MSVFLRIFGLHESVRRSGEFLRKMADPSACGVIPALDAQKVFADPDFAESIERLQRAFQHLKIGGSPSDSPSDR